MAHHSVGNSCFGKILSENGRGQKKFSVNRQRISFCTTDIANGGTAFIDLVDKPLRKQGKHGGGKKLRLLVAAVILPVGLKTLVPIFFTVYFVIVLFSHNTPLFSILFVTTKGFKIPVSLWERLLKTALR